MYKRQLLALGIAAHNNAQPEPLPQPRHIVAVSPGEVPWNDAERARMQALNKRDVSVDYAFMVTVEKFMRHGCENVPDYMLSGSRGDFTGVGAVSYTHLDVYKRQPLSFQNTVSIMYGIPLTGLSLWRMARFPPSTAMVRHWSSLQNSLRLWGLSLIHI